MFHVLYTVWVSQGLSDFLNVCFYKIVVSSRIPVWKPLAKSMFHLMDGIIIPQSGSVEQQSSFVRVWPHVAKHKRYTHAVHMALHIKSENEKKKKTLWQSTSEFHSKTYFSFDNTSLCVKLQF